MTSHSCENRAPGLPVVVVDDSATRRLRLAADLRTEGFSVDTATDGQEGLEVARRRRPAVIVADVLMPGMDGFELCRSVRADPELAEVPVVLLSATFVKPEHRELALAAGADVYTACELAAPLFAAMLHDLVAHPGAHRPAGLSDEQFRKHRNNTFRIQLLESVADLEEANAALRRAYDVTLAALVAALDVRDTGTEVHSRRVAGYAVALGRKLGLAGAELDDLRRAGLLHDIGKIGIADAVLRKPARLDPAEWAEMRTHPAQGYEILQGVPFLAGTAELVLAHHERYDGTGYPGGVPGEAIPYGARVLSVADTLDAITSERPYQRARPLDVALIEIEQAAGSQFDPEIAGVAVARGVRWWEALKQDVERSAHDVLATAPDPHEAGMAVLA